MLPTKLSTDFTVNLIAFISYCAVTFSVIGDALASFVAVVSPQRWYASFGHDVACRASHHPVSSPQAPKATPFSDIRTEDPV